MAWLKSLGEHARSIAAIIMLGGLISSAAVAGAKSYIDKQIATTVSQHIDEFRLEWRCSEWREELEDKRVKLADMDQETVAERVRLESRVEQLVALIRDNTCSRFDT